MKYLLIIGIVCVIFSCSKDSKDSKVSSTTRERVESSNFHGKWYTKNEVDSTIVLFEPSSLMIYVYERKTQQVIERIIFDRWYVTKYNIDNGELVAYYISLFYGYEYNEYDDYRVRFSEDFSTFTFYKFIGFSELTLTRIREE